MSTRARRGWTGVVVGVLLSVAACGRSDPSPDAAPTTATSTAAPTTTGAPSTTVEDPPHRSYIATARAVADVEVFDAPGGARRNETVPNPNEHGVVATFLVRTRAVEVAGQTWHEVYLPIRPNGSVGWIRDRDVDLTYTDLRVVVRLGEHRLDVLSEGRVIASYPAGIGRADTPTPGGVFFIKELLQPSDPDGPYGPYAFGLSGFSNVIVDDDRFGEGVIGIHGTNRPDLVGTDVSHGCIRLRNADIVALVGLLPLGTPVEILE